MSVLWVKEYREDGHDEDAQQRRTVRNFKVRVSSPLDNHNTIKASGMVPAAYSVYDGMLLRGRSFTPWGKSGRLWKVRCEYSNQVTQQEIEQDNNPNPVNRACHLDIVTIREQIPVFKDRDGKALTNILGRPYDPALMRWRTRMRFEGTKNVPASGGYPGWFFNLADCLNEEPFTIRGGEFDEKTLLFCTDRIPDKITEGTYSYFACRFAIEWTPEGWDQEVLQADVYQKVGGQVLRITEDGVPVTTPRKLNASGAVIDDPDPEEAFYKTHGIQFLADFSVLEDVLQ